MKFSRRFRRSSSVIFGETRKAGSLRTWERARLCALSAVCLQVVAYEAIEDAPPAMGEDLIQGGVANFDAARKQGCADRRRRNRPRARASAGVPLSEGGVSNVIGYVLAYRARLQTSYGMRIGEDVVDPGGQRPTQMLREHGFRGFLLRIAGALRFSFLVRTLRRLPAGDHGRERIRQRGRLLQNIGSGICHMPRTVLLRDSLRLAWFLGVRMVVIGRPPSRPESKA